MALEVGPGDEVITTPFTFFATAGAIARLGARPVFVDIDPVTFNIDIERVPDAITPRTKAIIPVDLFGQIPDLSRLARIACERALPIVEDAAQAIGATRDGRRAGSFGRTGCFSFYPTKNLSAMGDAGAIVTDDPPLARKLAILRNHGMDPRYYHGEVGGNFRCDAMQCAALRIKLRHIDRWNAGRLEAARRYDRLFGDARLTEHITLPVDQTGASAYHQYVIRAPRRDELIKHLQSKQVGCAIFYPVSLHEQQCFAGLGYKSGDLPESERAAREVLALPMFAEITPDEQAEVVAAIGSFYG
jgi:dTDP-4-amino-4,6-dideoxygalactose transaminase